MNIYFKILANLIFNTIQTHFSYRSQVLKYYLFQPKETSINYKYNVPISFPSFSSFVRRATETPFVAIDPVRYDM